MINNFIAIYDDALPRTICKEIISLFNGDKHLHYSGMTSSRDGDRVDLETKQATELSVSRNGHWLEVDDILYKNLSNYFQRYMLGLGDAYACSVSSLDDQEYRIRRYDVGGGFNWHVDTDTVHTCGRWIAAQWYFNTVYQGGETEFMNCGTTIRPVAGRLAFFPATWTYMHRSVPTYSGPKYICSTFFSPRWN